MNISASDIQNYLLNFFASPLQFTGDCSEIDKIVKEVEKDKEIDIDER